jgi:hypothetical protein
MFLKKATVTWPREKFPAFYCTWRFVTLFTRVRHWPLSRGRWSQPKLPIPSQTHFSSTLTSNFIHSNWFLSFRFSRQKHVWTLSSACWMPYPTHLSRLDHSNKIWWEIHVIKFVVIQLFPASYYFSPSHVQLVSSAPCYKTSSGYVLPLVWEPKFYVHKQLIAKE